MWNYIQPVEISFGAGRIKEIKDIATKKFKCFKGILVSDPFFVENGLANKIVSDSDGIFLEIYSNIAPNPDVNEVDVCAEIIRKKGIDFVVALGGGSVIDCAKAAATICLTNDSIRLYHGTGKMIPEEHLPLIAVPTTAGTGSEVTCVSVLTDHANGKKAPIGSRGFYPTYAIIDPELTYSMPPKVTAGTGMDVLSHALEGFWAKGHQPICDACAVHAAGLVFTYLYRCYKNPMDKEAREKMCEASVIAGLAFTLPKTTASHACSYPLTNLYHIPHGEACGLTLDYFTRINGSEKDQRVNGLAKKLGFAHGNEMAEAIHDLKACLGLRNDLKDLGLTKVQVDELVQISRHPNLYNNPVEITDRMLYEMYESLL